MKVNIPYMHGSSGYSYEWLIERSGILVAPLSSLQQLEQRRIKTVRTVSPQPEVIEDPKKELIDFGENSGMDPRAGFLGSWFGPSRDWCFSWLAANPDRTGRNSGFCWNSELPAVSTPELQTFPLGSMVR